MSLWPGDHRLHDRQPAVAAAHTTLHRVGGTARRGTLEGRMRVSRCYRGPARYTLATFLSDAFRTRAHHTGMPVRVIARDHIVPIFSTADVQADGHVVTWSFSEPVHGISADSAEVTTEDDQVIAGSWECRDGGEDLTSCLTGAVRSATFTPDDPSSAGPVPSAVTFAPEHHLEVLDRHGNPVLESRNVQAD